MQIDTLQTSQEWKVLLTRGAKWRIGVYRPQLKKKIEIQELEKHNCPESFLLVEGEIIMNYRDENGIIQEKKLELMQLTTFIEPHAGYSPAGNGVALVVEDATFETVYTDINTNQEKRVVKV